jgi:hypothetical protein
VIEEVLYTLQQELFEREQDYKTIVQLRKETRLLQSKKIHERQRKAALRRLKQRPDPLEMGFIKKRATKLERKLEKQRKANATLPPLKHAKYIAQDRIIYPDGDVEIPLDTIYDDDFFQNEFLELEKEREKEEMKEDAEKFDYDDDDDYTKK